MKRLSSSPRLAAISRVTLLIVVTVLAFAWPSVRLEKTKYADLVEDERTPAVRDRVIETYSQQSENLTNWSLTLLGAIIAIAVTTKVHPIRYFSTIFIILGPAGAFSFGCIRAGWAFRRRIANMIAHDDTSDLASLSSLLLQQTQFFRYALLCAGIFGAWYLLNVVFGAVRPYDLEKTDEQ